MRNVETALKGVTSGANETLVETRTNRNGEFAVCISESELSGGREVYVQFTAANPAVFVTDIPIAAGGVRYVGRSDLQTVNASSGSVNLSTSVPKQGPWPAYDRPAVFPNSNNTAFHIADSALEARLFVKNRTSDNWTPKRINVVHPSVRTAYYPAQSGGTISLENYSDTHAAIWHEYGHLIRHAAYNYNDSRAPRGPSLNLSNNCHTYDTRSNYGYALEEGWAEYTEAVISGSWNDSRSYHDASSSICPPTGKPGQYDGYRVEGSITSVLYNLTAERNPNNPAAVSFQDIFEVFRTEYPQSIYEVYEHLRPKSPDPERVDEIFLDHGIDVAPPDITVSGNTTRVIEDPVIQFGGTASDPQVNMSRVQFRVLTRVDDGQVTGPEDWQTMIGPNETQWGTSFLTGAERVDVQIRASDRFGNNATRTITYYRRGEVPTVDGTMVRDPDADGVYEDLTGDGQSSREDVLTYYDNRKNATIRGDNPRFDYDGDGVAGTVSDALALYEQQSETRAIEK